MNKKGLCTGGNLALGYDVDENKRFIINEGEAAIVKRIFEMYLAGNTMTEIIRYLNDNGIKSSRRNNYDKNSIRRILTNRRYCGVYTFKGDSVPSVLPRIIDDKTFADVQILMDKNKKAPARAKAIEENYILTTKLFCGYCGTAITGVSGTARNGSIHQYYQCVSNRRKRCDKKTVRKAYIEDYVINKVVQLLTPEKIDELARSIEARCEKERNTENLKRLNKLIRENETATANLIKALEAGKAADVIASQIEKRQQEKSDLEAQIARERIQAPLLKYEQMRFFFERFTKGDPDDIHYRRALVDILIGRIELYNDRVVIYCNAYDKQILSPIDVPSGSSMGRMVGHQGFEPRTNRL